jgi:plasmid stabilization system protein ParE
VEAVSISIILSPAAQADIADAIAWYESSSPGLSWDFRMALDACLDQVARYPDASAKVAPSVRRALLRRFSLAVYYRQQKGVVQIIAILHTHRHPRIWQDRDS